MAQNDSANTNCKALYKYEYNTMLMSPLPVTAVNFYDVSEGNVIAWSWDFGDGETSSEQNPLHVFNRPVISPNVKINPYREVVLTILTADSCTSFYADTINIMEGIPNTEPCRAAFKYYQLDYDSVSATASVQLTNLSEGDSLRYFWQFDDGITSTEKEPLVAFDINQYENKVCLTVTGADSCTSTFCDVVYISNPNDTIFYPDECYTGFGYQINHTVQTFAPALVLDFYSKSDPVAVEWNWDFGDGTTSNEENPMHIFNFPIILDSILGDPNPFREVCLTVTTESGCEATYCETINVYMVDSTITEPNKKCQARFKYYQPEDIVTIPEVIPYQFNDASNGDVVSWLWEFEDGTTSTEAEPQVNFDFLKPTQYVCLTIFTADSCTSTWCETIYVSGNPPDSTYIENPELNYIMRYESSFPIQMSSCAGYVKAQVYLGDSIIKADNYKWSHGVEGQEANGFCPTQTYSVKAKTPDGNIVSGTFVFNSDGTVTEMPVNWWVSGEKENPVIQFNLNNKGYFVEWKLCDGTYITADSISFDLINCDTQESNLILRDSLGNIVYAENISSKSLTTFLNTVQRSQEVKLFPNPVKDVLNIQYTGNTLDEMIVEIYDISGKNILIQHIQNVESGQNIGVNVNALKNGIYLCRMTSNSQLIGMEKFAK